MSIEIKFPREFDEYIYKNNIYGEILINYDLPYYLDTKNACYEMLLDTEFFDGFPNKPRKMLINIERKWHENQGVALRGSTFSVGSDNYGFQSSSIQVLIQVHEDEMDIINNLFKDINSFQEVIQKSLEIFIIKYNINMNGNHFVTPSASDCSMTFIILYKNWLQYKEDINGYISPNISKSCNYDMDEHIYDSSLEIQMYRYFLNKARYSRANFDYIDTIISGAIAIESFVYDTIRHFRSDDNEVDSYTYSEEDNKYYSVFQLIRKLIEDNYLINKNELSMSKLRTYVSDVLSPRNDLMHGKLKGLEGLNSRAKKSFESLNEIFDNLLINDTIHNSNINSKEIVISFNKQKAINDINKSFELTGYDRIHKLEKVLELDCENAFVYKEIGAEYSNLGEVDKGIYYCEKALEYTFLKDEIYYNIGLNYIIKKEYTKAIEYLKLIKYMPKRESKGFCINNYYIFLGECYLNLSRDDYQLNYLKISKTKALELAIKNFKMIEENENMIYKKYRNLIIAYMDSNNFVKALNYCEKVLEINEYKPEIIAFKAYCNLKHNNIKESLKLIESILDTYDNKAYIKDMLEFVIETNDSHKEKSLELLCNIK
ncbi:tetratricopeptide repeat protein [Paraclostridium bifermentans]|uniref:tetratricopeptide repeat protein n=1 Tax=Paraclostridium bifermentans TaxID=1490 RepID=UPI00214A236C|nr:tetratricopeptide repeat protein [Paraclostridium bifermentans]MCR1876423.1 tetratricopeptide repeat protein [Paraclostridium bifermentans]